MVRCTNGLCVGLMIPVALAVSGCGGGYGSELSARPLPMQLASGPNAAVQIPGDAGFAIHTSTAQKNAGPGGAAEASADALPDGTATAEARVAGGDSAMGGFQLGHGFENTARQQADVEVTVSFTYAFSIAADEQHPDASVGLSLYARDDDNRLLHEQTLLNHASDRGNVTSAGSDDVRITVTLGPARRAYVYLGGSARVQTPPEREATARLQLRDVNMSARTEVAPPVRTSGDEQP